MRTDRTRHLLPLLSLALLSPTLHAGGVGPGARLADAAEAGAFTTGQASGTLRPPGDGPGRTLDYRLPPGTAVGVWAKRFPAPAGAPADLVTIAVEPTSAEQLEAAVELKGSAGVQRVSVPLGAKPPTVTLDWPRIGELTEVVVILSRTGDAGEVAGTARVSLEFAEIPPLNRLATSPPARLAGALLLAGALAAAWAAAGVRPGGGAAVGGLRRDFVLGAGAVGVAALVCWVYRLGGAEPLAVGWSALAVSLAGAGLTIWLKIGLTGRLPTAGELFWSLAATGTPAASAAPLALLQAPASWADVLALSGTAAAGVVLVFQAANLARIASDGRGLSAVTSAVIAATPYLFGLLLLLRPDGPARQIGAPLFESPVWEGLFGRAVVLFAFNALAAQALGYAANRRCVASLAAHGWYLLAAVAAVAAPWVAAWGSSGVAASATLPERLAVVLVSVAASQAALWAEVYLITGMVTDALQGRAPTAKEARASVVGGARKGAVFAGVFFGILYLPMLAKAVPGVAAFADASPTLAGVLAGVVLFPLVKTIIETFDGSTAFFRRLFGAYRDPVLLGRGLVVGAAVGFAADTGLTHRETPWRALYGFLFGAAAYAGVNLLRDLWLASTDRGGPPGWRVSLVQALLGGFIGAAVGFYADDAQVATVVGKYHRYLGAGEVPERFGVYPLVSKWGFVDLGTQTGGTMLFFLESLAGVIEWSIPAWLFALNRRFLSAALRKESAPVAELFTAGGLRTLGLDMIAVFRWGLWMSPIIKSFLRPMGEPTWYNQDGAVRTALAVVQDVALPHDAFRDWSLRVFTMLLASDIVRVLIWADHMGLRVATLVNLSFLGMDRLDRRLARFLGPAATARCIPEAVKRFTTWAPLLIPFYIPRGTDWDRAWDDSQKLLRASEGDALSRFLTLPSGSQWLIVAGAVAATTLLFAAGRLLRGRLGWDAQPNRTLANAVYEVTRTPEGQLWSHATARGYDVTRRSYDRLDPAGRALFLQVDGATLRLDATLAPDGALAFAAEGGGVRARLEVSLPAPDAAAELWTVTLESDAARDVRLVPYLEWVLNKSEADRSHTQYNRLFAEVEYVAALNAVLAHDKHSKAVGVLACDHEPDGFLSARVDFLGRAGRLAEVVPPADFFPARDTDSHPTFDPVGALSVPVRGAVTVRFLVGMTANKAEAAKLVARFFGRDAAGVPATRRRKDHHPIRHGAIPPGTAQPYYRYSDDGRTLFVDTPFTPRPYDHALSNELGQLTLLTNRGLHSTCSVNSQQNRLTPDWADTVTRELPGEAFYVHDPATGEWFSPTYHPTNDASANPTSAFGADGTALFRSAKNGVECELSVFVPPAEPATVYRLTVRNTGTAARTLKVAPYFQIVLAAQPEHAGPLDVRRDPARRAVLFESPRNPYRWGPAFVAASRAPDAVETDRGRFFGAGGVPAPGFLAGQAGADADGRPVAAFLFTLELAPGASADVTVLLGQAGDRRRAEAAIDALLAPGAADKALAATRDWWGRFLDAVRVKTTDPAFDGYLAWLRYQALAERIWARRGFYQSSGAFGFRDQLQDSVNLLWADPGVARRQILLHAAQQFVEGDVVHWFHQLQDGRTALVGRTHASDNLLWLVWAVVDYLAATGDTSILDEKAAYLESDLPFLPLPEGKHGMGFDPLRSSRSESVYRHCLRAIDLVLDKRMGRNGLPLMGTGDWNDGLDEIGSQGKGESVWLGLFLYYSLSRFVEVVPPRDGAERADHYRARVKALGEAIERTWRGDRYLRAIHDDGTEIGVAGSGVWEIDALTASWAVTSGVNPERGRIVFDTALRELERDTTILLGTPPLREDTHPYLGRSSAYPEGVRENGMYSHGVQWLVGAARVLSEQRQKAGDAAGAAHYRDAAERLWRKISPLGHLAGDEIETYGGQPNKQSADMVTTFDPGRMIWHGYTGAAGWMFRQALEGVLGLRLDRGKVVAPPETPAAGAVKLLEFERAAPPA